MRRSDRLKRIEMQVAALEIEIDLLIDVINMMCLEKNPNSTDIESGKWYRSKPDGY